MSNPPPSRRNLRWDIWNYQGSGVYFVTICTQSRQPLLGRISESKVALSETGQIVSACWLELPDHFPTLTLGEHVVMPDHVHGIVRIESNHWIRNRFAGEVCLAPTITPLSTVVASFKSASTRTIRDRTGLDGQRVWQRGYHDRIVRGLDELDRIQQYIRENPSRHRPTRQPDGGPPPGGTRGSLETSM